LIHRPSAWLCLTMETCPPCDFLNDACHLCEGKDKAGYCAAAFRRMITVTLFCQSFDDLEDLDVLLIDRLKSMGISDADIEQETEVCFNDASGKVIAFESVECASFPVMVRISLEVKSELADSVSVVFNLIDGRQFSVRLHKSVSLQELKAAAEHSTGIPSVELEPFLNFVRIGDVEAPLSGEQSEVVHITLLRSWMGRAAAFVRELQTSNAEGRQSAIETLRNNDGNASISPESLAQCLGEMTAERVNADPDFLKALQACLQNTHDTGDGAVSLE